MKILLTGKTDFEYNRVRVLTDGLKKLKDVTLLFFPITSHRTFDKQAFARLEEQADFVYVPPFRHRDVSLIRRLTKKPLVFDPLISKLLTKDDFGHFWKLPFKYLLDKIPFNKCDILLADTACHKSYFSKVFNIPKEKICVLPIGVSTDSFYKSVGSQTQDGIFRVGFYGSFVPLQGTDKIMEMAHILSEHKDISFEIVGGGYRFKQAKALAEKWKLKNVNFHGVLKYDDLNAQINQFDLCLGIFGDSKKSDFVIPNKIYHYASVGKCIITKDSDGIKEIFTDKKDIVLTSTNPAEVAEEILNLKVNRNLIDNIGQNAYRLINENYNEEQIAKRFIQILNDYNKSKQLIINKS
jgi:glycosyltransferase involved in cell wall biosynthesis